MSSRQKKRAQGLERRLATAPDPTLVAVGDVVYDAEVAAVQQIQAQRTHRDARSMADHVAAARYRQKHPQPLDWLGDYKDRRWEFATMTDSDETDSNMGAPVLKEDFAGFLSNRMASAFDRALAHLDRDRPAQAVALRTVFGQAPLFMGVWAAAELAAADLLEAPVRLVRIRAWKAARILEADCQESAVPELSAYLAYRRHQLCRQNSKERTRAWAFVVPFA